MELRQGDIIERRERNGRKAVWVSEECLLRVFIDQDETYFRKVARYRYSQTVPARFRERSIQTDTGASWRWARMKGRYYYDYDRLPEERRAQLPPAEELLKLYETALAESRQSELEKRIRSALRNEYRQYMHLYSAYSDEQNTLLAGAAAVVMAAAYWAEEKEVETHRSRFWKDLARVVRQVHVRYIPGNWRRLKEKVVAVLDGQNVEDVVDLPRAGNSNARKYSDEELVSWIIQLRQAPQNYTNAHIIRIMKLMCRMAGKATPSTSWFSTELAKPKTKWLTAPGRFGDSRHAAGFHGYTPIENAVYAGDCWQVDGTRVNFLPYWTEDGRKEFLYIIAVTDVHSGDLLGWHLDTKEDRWGYAEALRMACNMAGYLPWELVIDRFPGHNTEEWKTIQKRMEREGVKVTITSKKTGKAKVERLFSTIQTVFMQHSPYYYGEGIQSRNLHAHRSAEYLKGMEKEARANGWNFEASCKETVRILEMYRNTRYNEYSRRFHDIEKSPKELHDASDKPHVVRVEPWIYVELFGLEKSVTIRGGIIKTTIQKAEYTYLVDDYEVVANYRQVTLCYDLDDLSRVYLFEPSNDINRQFLCEINEERAAQIYGPEADHSQLGRVQKRLKKLEERRKEELEEIVEAGAGVPMLLGPFSSKDDSKSAENRYYEEVLLSRANNTLDLGKKKPSEEDEDLDDDIHLSVRNLY